ncbi:DUF4255 domain-containing protein [Sphingomonas sp. 28-63-12]|uniref:DUF4255 domain-containing protein n=1 Tax=Sphingomonas sp. 28-63-12 TaxID=1970434 RepID=UPI000BDA91E0|nr:MAG: hypothetical protein B7Y47_14425 [Sphingomonas sp. 28-63-12]
MSNARAIAAATASLRNLLLAQVPLMDTDLSDLEVTTQPLDLARKNVTKAQLNLFLYETAVNAAWRNHDLPAQLRPGETGTPPVALNLRYLLTAYGRGDSDNDATSHRVLGAAVGLLNDHPLLGSAEIAAAMANNDLGDQVERVRVSWRPIGIDEMSKLWTMFQGPYRVSTVYEVGVVLIDSRRPVRAPLPVLRRGAEDVGAVAIAGLAPSIERLRLPRSQSAVQLGEQLSVLGDNLGPADTSIIISSALLAQEITLAPLAGPPGELATVVADVADDPDALARWHPGYCLLVVRQQHPNVPPISSNALALAIAPRITVAPLAAATGDVVLTVTCAPRLRNGQKALLIFGDRQASPDSITTPADPLQPSELQFTIPQVTIAGNYVVRLRIDGVDSIPVIYAGTPPIPAFDPAQTVAVS